jgi:trans-2,3-dihydro-3-hydroxyanthranilate isomerase
MDRRFLILDVFTRHAFGGNQLAVLPDASGLSTADMQTLAREFNFPESTFVLPPDDKRNTCRVRIFTPTTEMAFAGHPTVGTACALVYADLAGTDGEAATTLILEEGVGPIRVVVDRSQPVLSATLTRETSIEEPADRVSFEDMAALLSVERSAVVDSYFASAGARFCFAELATVKDVDAAVLNLQEWERKLSRAWSPHVYLYSGDKASGGRLHARMFAPALGISEDPATGGAAAALVGALANRLPQNLSDYTIAIDQGVTMGRRSEIQARATRVGGQVVSVDVGGAAVLVAEGTIASP